MYADTQEKIVSLSSFHIEIGQRYTVTVTGATSTAALEFKHGGDTSNWHADPNFTGTVTNGVIQSSFRCVSGRYRLNFASAPSAAVQITVVADAVPTF